MPNPPVSTAIIAAQGVLLTVSAAILLAYAVFGFLNASRLARIVSATMGAAYLAYGGYLVLFYDHGRVLMSLWVYMPPALLVVNAFRARRKAKAARQLEQARANHARDAMPPRPPASA